MNFLERWMHGIVFVVVGILGLCALMGGCVAMVVIPSGAFVIPYEYIEPKWLGATIGVLCMLVVFGAMFALFDDTR